MPNNNKLTALAMLSGFKQRANFICTAVSISYLHFKKNLPTSLSISQHFPSLYLLITPSPQPSSPSPPSQPPSPPQSPLSNAKNTLFSFISWQFPHCIFRGSENLYRARVRICVLVGVFLISLSSSTLSFL